MENKVTLSVVVLSYNNEQYLEDCLALLKDRELIHMKYLL